MWPFRNRDLYLVFVVRDPHKRGDLWTVCASRKRAEAIARGLSSDGRRIEVERWRLFRDLGPEYHNVETVLRCYGGGE